MTQPHIQLADGIPDLAALGAREARDLFAGGGALEDEERARVVSCDPVSTLLRYPLPGTPAEGGGLTGRPRGAGTGWLFLRRYHFGRGLGRGVGELLAARFTQPRSQNLAVREWNVLCHLRARGVATPEPLAVGTLGQGLVARESFLITRELDGMLPLHTWLERTSDPDMLRRASLALGIALRALFDAGVWLPRFGARHVHLSTGTEQGACTHGLTLEGGLLPFRNLPEVAFTGFRGARLQPSLSEARRVELLERLASELEVEPKLALRVPKLALRVLRGALAGPRARRHALWRSSKLASGAAHARMPSA